MERPGPDTLLLRHLALIYIQLAHGTDAALDDAEIDLIAERLRAWQNQEVAQGTVLSALKEALEQYADREEHPGHLDAAIQAVRNTLPENKRQRLLDDLMDLARVDARVLFEEARFIGRLAQAWGVLGHTAPSPLWNVLSAGEEGDWTPVHDLAVTYLALGHATDQHLSTSEIEAIPQRLAEWLPEADATTLLGVLRRALSEYAQSTDRQRRLRQSIEGVKEHMPRHQRAALLIDLYHVAKADGVLLDAEQAMIEELSEAWGIALSRADE